MTNTHTTQYFWNGEPCCAEFLLIRITDGSPSPPLAWWREFIGEERQAIRIKHDDSQFIIDNHDGLGYYKITTGRGMYWRGHRSIMYCNVVRALEDSEINRNILP